MSKAKACEICQARKVKCDRLKPACSPCIKYRWNCPGYPAGGDNVAYGNRASRKRRSRASRPARHDEKSPQYLPNSVQRRSKVASANTDGPSIRDIPLQTPAAELIGYLSLATSPGKSLRQLDFINLVPPRLGLCAALDDAVRCLCAAYGAFLSSRSILDSALYRQALKSLQKSLTNEDEALSCEVLCAVVCLSWCEVLTNNVDASWLVHTIGFSRLVQLRGPSRHMGGFGRALLHAEHGLLPCLAMVLQTPCFLNTPDWQATVDSPLPSIPHREGSRTGTTAAHFAESLLSHYKLMTRLSEARCNAMTAGLSCEPSDAAKLTAILQKYHALRDECKASLHATSTIGSNLPSPSESSWLCDGLSLLFCKDALGQIIVNTAMLELYGSLHSITAAPMDDSAKESRSAGLRPTIAAAQGKPTDIEKLLNTEVEALFELALRSYSKAKETSPLGMRRLVATYRIVCAQTRGKQGYHPVWDKIEHMIRR